MNKIYMGVVGVVIAGAAFWGGTVYAKSSAPQRGQFAAGQFAGRAGAARTGGLTAGSIIAKDSSSITIKMQDGSTKIVLVSTSTPVLKMSQTSMNDLSVGTDVSVTGQANADGSITANSVQVRPAGMQRVNAAQ